MSGAISDLDELLRTMAPRQHPGVFVYASVPAGTPVDVRDTVATMHEDEGLSVIVREADVERLGLDVICRCAWLTLDVHSDLEAVGLTAAFSAALGAAGISCNVVAGACHDHLFVPVEDAEAALGALRALQASAAAGSAAP